MMIQAVNYVMLLILLAIGCIAFCIRKSPHTMTQIAAWLMSTAEADEARAKYHAKRHAAWRRELGIESSGPQLVREEREA